MLGYKTPENDVAVRRGRASSMLLRSMTPTRSPRRLQAVVTPSPSPPRSGPAPTPPSPATSSHDAPLLLDRCQERARADFARRCEGQPPGGGGSGGQQARGVLLECQSSGGTWMGRFLRLGARPRRSPTPDTPVYEAYPTRSHEP